MEKQKAYIHINSAKNTNANWPISTNKVQARFIIPSEGDLESYEIEAFIETDATSEIIEGLFSSMCDSYLDKMKRLGHINE